MSFDNINVNVSGPVQPTSTYKTKVLKGNHSFASQVTEPNMKYVIKHNFVLDGDVTIPANCILEFDGGSITEGNINFNGAYVFGKYQFNNIVGATGVLNVDVLDADNFTFTDDTVAIKFYWECVGPKKVCLSNRTYNINSGRDFKWALKSNITGWEFDGRDAIILDAYEETVSETDQSFRMLYCLDNCNDVKVHNITYHKLSDVIGWHDDVEGYNKAGGKGFFLAHHVKNLYVYDCTAINCSEGFGVYATPVGTSGYSGDSGTTIDNPCDNINISVTCQRCGYMLFNYGCDRVNASLIAKDYCHRFFYIGGVNTGKYKLTVYNTVTVEAQGINVQDYWIPYDSNTTIYRNSTGIDIQAHVFGTNNKWVLLMINNFQGEYYHDSDTMNCLSTDIKAAIHLYDSGNFPTCYYDARSKVEPIPRIINACVDVFIHDKDADNLGNLFYYAPGLPEGDTGTLNLSNIKWNLHHCNPNGTFKAVVRHLYHSTIDIVANCNMRLYTLQRWDDTADDLDTFGTLSLDVKDITIEDNNRRYVCNIVLKNYSKVITLLECLENARSITYENSVPFPLNLSWENGYNKTGNGYVIGSIGAVSLDNFKMALNEEREYIVINTNPSVFTSMRINIGNSIHNGFDFCPLMPKSVCKLIVKRINGAMYSFLTSEAVSYPTTSRPTTTIVGCSIFDKTLGKPIYWNSTAWVDATGTPV